MKKYEAIYNKILNLIESKKIKPGELLPSEHMLCQEYGVSRDTIRKSLVLLSRNGYIQKSQGKGSIVLDISRFDFPVSGLASFKEIAATLDHQVETVVRTLECRPAGTYIAQQMQIQPQDKIWYIERVRKIDGEAVILDIDYINAEIIPHLDRKILEDSLYAYIENTMGLDVSYAQKEFSCTPISGLDEQALDLKNYTMMVQVTSFVFLEDTRLFQHTISRHRPDKFRFKDFARRVSKKLNTI